MYSASTESSKKRGDCHSQPNGCKRTRPSKVSGIAKEIHLMIWKRLRLCIYNINLFNKYSIVCNIYSINILVIQNIRSTEQCQTQGVELWKWALLGCNASLSPENEDSGKCETLRRHSLTCQKLKCGLINLWKMIPWTKKSRNAKGTGKKRLEKTGN